MDNFDQVEDLRKIAGEIERHLLDYEQSVASLRFAAEPLIGLTRMLSQWREHLLASHRVAAVALARNVEDLIESHLTANAPLSRECIDTVLGALDTIVEGLADTVEPRRRIEAVNFRMEALIAARRSSASPSRHKAYPYVLDEQELIRVRAAQEQGLRAFIVETNVTSTIDQVTYNNLALYEELRKLGRVLAVRPYFAELAPMHGRVCLCILAATTHDEATLRQNLSTDFTFATWPDTILQPQTAPVAHARAPVVIREPPGMGRGVGIVPKIPVTDSVSIKLSRLPTDSRSRRILIVEDEFVSRSLLLALLGNYGACDVAVDGREAVAAAIRALKELLPYDLICLDIMMPDLDGHQALAQIRAAEAESGLGPANRAKIVMTTALSDYESFHRAYEASCDSYIVKPISKSVLIRQLRRIGIEPLI